MKFPWSKILPIAARVGAAVITGVPTIEAMTESLRTPGADKKAAVLNAVRAELATAENIAGHDLANDPDVLGAASAVIDAVTHFHNMLASKMAAGTGV